jgi:hypothetical protein
MYRVSLDDLGVGKYGFFEFGRFAPAKSPSMTTDVIIPPAKLAWETVNAVIWNL